MYIMRRNFFAMNATSLLFAEPKQLIAKADKILGRKKRGQFSVKLRLRNGKHPHPEADAGAFAR